MLKRSYTMFQRMLIPLDGSKRAERAIPIAARIARASGGSLILLRAVGTQIEFGTYMTEPSVLIQEALELDLTRAIDYLARIKMSNELAGIETTMEVRSGGAAQTILDVAQMRHVDLIVICSHGDTGFRRWVLGSVAQQVARHSPLPVLVLSELGPVPTSSFPDPTRPLRALMGLVALDGSVGAEAALEPAAKLVAALTAPARGILRLTRVVDLPANEHGRGSHMRIDPFMKEEILSDAKTYLSGIADRLQSGPLADLKLTIVFSVAMGRDVAKALLGVAETGKDAEGTAMLGSCDLMAMATHGRGGLQRLALGSVTERVLEVTRRPLLVVHARPPGGSFAEGASHNHIGVRGATKG
jgi:nucleotide-binding universal stress UspA family protein